MKSPSSSTSSWLSPPAGSSSSRNVGCAISARAISTRFWVPYGSAAAGTPARLAEPDDVERLERVPLLDPPTERVPADEDVLEDGHRPEEVDVLERPRDAPPHDLVRRGAQQRRAVELDLAGVRRVEPRDDVEHRRLARAVRADQARDDAPVDVEGDAVESDDAAEPQRDVPHREQHRARILEARCDEGRAGAGYGRRGALRSARPAAPARSRAPAATKAAVTSRGRSSRPTRDPRPA